MLYIDTISLPFPNPITTRCSRNPISMATGIPEKDLVTVTRRVTAVSNHLLPPPPISISPILSSSNCSASMNDSYHRIHGEVPSHLPVWKIACDESGKEFTYIIYEKAEGEAIAKGGSGSVQGVLFSNIQVSEVEFPIMIDQYYCDHSSCKNHTSAVALSNIAYENIKGTYTVKPVHM